MDRTIAPAKDEGLWSARGWHLVETLLLVVVFAAVCATPPPDVGESHYLAKAKHYWNSSWCAGDVFLESADVHVAFYWTFGWLTRLLWLEATAWTIRVITWSLLALAWTRLSWSVVPRPLVSVATGTLFALLQAHANLAGEWVIGGAEAKGIAYVFVLLALEAVAAARWPLAVLLAGAATAFHVLVGGWLVVLVVGAWLARGAVRARPLAFLCAAIAAAVVASIGVLPALAINRGAESSVVQEANRIYVFERLRHHLDFNSFSNVHLFRFALQLGAWALLMRASQKPLWRNPLQAIVAGALAIAFLGVGIQEMLSRVAMHFGMSAGEYERLAAGPLKYYWFRMSDSLLPVGVSLAAAPYFLRLAARGGQENRSVALVAAACVCLALAWRAASAPMLPGAIVQPLPKDGVVRSSPSTATIDEMPAKNDVPVPAWSREWIEVCRWIESSTPPTAIFITPRRQQTFKWYAERAEVANWKDMPQDARRIAAWRRMIEDVYGPLSGRQRQELEARSDYELAALARRYRASYLVVERTADQPSRRLTRCYPPADSEATLFRVYELP